MDTITPDLNMSIMESYRNTSLLYKQNKRNSVLPQNGCPTLRNILYHVLLSVQILL